MMLLLKGTKKFRESLAAQSLFFSLSFKVKARFFPKFCCFLFDGENFSDSCRNNLTSDICLLLTDEICFYHSRSYIIMETLQGTGRDYRNEIRKEYC